MQIGVIGATGRMGQELVREVINHQETTLGYALVRSSSPWLGRPTSDLVGGSPTIKAFGADPAAMWQAVDAVIDFTQPANTLALTKQAAQHGKPCVIGTSGFTAAELAELRELATRIPIVYSNNMSLGVNILTGLVKQVAAMLGDDFDIEVVEMHHRYKKDAPSGTALMLGEAAAAGRQIKLADHAVFSREGMTGERTPGDIGFATLRGGNVIGDHAVIFAGDSERLELHHKAGQRSLFAKGAVRAALWTKGKKPGFYTMHDVLFT